MNVKLLWVVDVLIMNNRKALLLKPVSFHDTSDIYELAFLKIECFSSVLCAYMNVDFHFQTFTVVSVKKDSLKIWISLVLWWNCTLTVMCPEPLGSVAFPILIVALRCFYD